LLGCAPVEDEERRRARPAEYDVMASLRLRAGRCSWASHIGVLSSCLLWRGVDSAIHHSHLRDGPLVIEQPLRTAPSTDVAGVSPALRSPGFRRLVVSAAIVIFGIMGQAVARGWLARELTGSNAGLGGVMLVFGLSMLLATPWGGVAADRYPKRTVLLVAVGVLILTSAFVGVAVIGDAVQYWMLVAASALQAAAFAFYVPARIAFLAELVDASAIDNAVVVSQVSQEAMRVVAPALAGLLIGVSWFGPGGVFLLSAGLCAVAAAVIVNLPVGRPAAVAQRSPIRDMADAVAYVRQTHGLVLVSATTIGVVMLGFPFLTFLPTIADEVLDVGAGGYGVMAGAAGAGAVVAGFATLRSNSSRRPWRTLGLAGVVFGLSLIALGSSSTLPLTLLILTICGASSLLFQTTSQALLLRLSDVEYHGRLQSMVILGFSGFGLAALPLGLTADAIGLQPTLAAMGAVIIAIVGVFWLVHLRHRRAMLPLDVG
jgi:MFS family permease